MSDMPDLTAAEFETRVRAMQSDDELRKIQRYFKTGEGDYGEGDVFIGVRMGSIFALAKEFLAMEPAEIETLLESPVHELRVGAVSIMAKQAAHKKTSEDRRKELFDLYLRRHDRINNWDLVDLGAWNVVGRYLAEKPRDVLYELARSTNPWERRTAALANMHFIRTCDIDDAFRVCELLLAEPEEIIQKSVGWVLREAGQCDPPRLAALLDAHAATMPRVMLRSAIEKLEKEQRTHYMGLGKRPKR